jgi:hypothetical protein
MKCYLILLLLIFGINASSQTYYVDKNLYPYLFDTGSSWIYEKNNTSIFDTVTLIKFEHGFDWDVKTYYEYYKLFFSNSNNKDTYDFQFKMQAIYLEGNKYRTQIYKKDKLINHFDSLMIKNVNYYDVDVIKTDSNILYYWSKNVGVIKIDSTFHNNNITLEWNLIKCKTNKFTDISLTDNQNTQLKVYPNPAADKINIDCAIRQDLTLQIYNTFGQSVLKRELNNQTNEIDISSLIRGIYILKLTSPKGTIEKIIIKK